MDANEPPWPRNSEFVDPDTHYVESCDTFIAVFRHEDHPHFRRKIFLRGPEDDRYRRIFSMDERRAQDELVVDCTRPFAAFNELRIVEEVDGANPIYTTRYDVENERVLNRIEPEDLNTPSPYRRVVYISELFELCGGGDELKCVAALESDEEHYDFWVCSLSWDRAELELLAEMGGVFC